jgi:hypothetical protein
MPQNTFWIAANIMFDLETGKTKQILLLVNRQEDATFFNSEVAQNYLNFVKQRAGGIVWVIEPLDMPVLPIEQQRFVIKGVQYV